MNFCLARVSSEEIKDKPRIPRPPNAFMLYANENRKRMSQLFPTESNKDISKRLGNGWKCLEELERKRFFDRAKAIGLQHKKEYPDYVYNPKEARIRKAMRDATRERSMGTSSVMMQRMGAARRGLPPAHVWGQPPPPTSGPQQPPSHEELMMPPMAPMQPANVYGGGGGGEPFLDAMTAYSKLEAAPPPMPPPNANYMQGNPLAQLQQQTEMWPEYQAIRPRSSGNPYIMDEVAPYPPTPLMMDKEAHPPPPSASAPPPTDEPEPDKEPEREHFIPVFEQPEEAKMKKFPAALHLPLSSHALLAAPGLFSSDLTHQKAYIGEYFRTCSPSMTLTTVTTPSGTSFPYAVRAPGDLHDALSGEVRLFEDVAEPIFFNTDVGYVPLSTVQ